jgi:MFS family permease
VVAEEGAPDWRRRIQIPALVLASGISGVGNALTSLAIPWFVLVTTGSAARTGIAGAAVLLSMVVSGFLSGAAVDRLGYKLASILSDLASGVTLALIPTLYYTGILNFWLLLGLIFLGTFFDSPGFSARTALVPALTREAGTTLERVNSAMQLATQGANILIGPLLAGVLIAALGAPAVLYVTATTFAVAIVLIGVFVSAPKQPVAEAASDTAPVPRTSYLGEIREGVRFITRDTFLAALMPMAVLLNFLFSPLSSVVLPVYARDEFDSARVLGLLFAAFGVGMVLGTAAYGGVGHRVGRYATLVGSVLVIAAGTWILALAGPYLALAVFGNFVIGLAIGPMNTLLITLIQVRSPAEMYGRVLSLLSAFSSSVASLGIVTAGFYIEWSNARVALITISIGASIAAARIVLSPALRKVAPEIERAYPGEDASPA